MADDPTIGGHSRWFTLAVLFGLLFVLFASILAVGAIDSPGPGVALAGQGGEGGGDGLGDVNSTQKGPSSDSNGGTEDSGTEGNETENSGSSPSASDGNRTQGGDSTQSVGSSNGDTGGETGGGLGALNPGTSTGVGGETGFDDDTFGSNDTSIHFRVESSQPSYWRTGSYDTYTGTGWERPNSVSPYDSPLNHEGPTGERIEYRVTLEQPATALPTAWRPRTVSGVEGLRVTDDGSFRTGDPLEPGTAFSGVSHRSVRDPGLLRSTSQDYPTALEQRYTQLPADTPDRVGQFTADITANADTAFDTAITVQNWLQSSKEYSLEASQRSPHMADTFIFEMERGYCEYFATTMVAMLRSQDIPSRYVVGYSPGQQVSEDTYEVRGMNAHAWVEVYFEGVGWVQFDPTPSGPRQAAQEDALSQGSAEDSESNDGSQVGDSDGSEESTGGEQNQEDSQSDGDSGSSSDGSDSESGDDGTDGEEQSQDGEDGETGENGDTSDGEGGEENDSQNDDEGDSENQENEEQDDGDEDQSEEDQPEENQSDEEQPEEDETEETIPGPPYEITVSPEPVPGQNVTVTVEKNGTAVEGLEVSFNEQVVGTTDSSGRVEGTIPYANEVLISARRPPNESTSVGRFGVAAGSSTFSTGTLFAPTTLTQSDTNSSVTYEIPTNVTVESQEVVVPDRTVEATMSLNGSAVSGLDVIVAGETVARTDEAGNFTLPVPAAAEIGERLPVRFERDEFLGEGNLTVAEIEVDLDAGLLKLPGMSADVSVTAVEGEQTVPLGEVPIRANGGEVVALTDGNGTAAITLPWSNEGTATAIVGENTVTASVSGMLLHLLLILGAPVVVLIGAGVWLRRNPERVKLLKHRAIGALVTAGHWLRQIGHWVYTALGTVRRRLLALAGRVRNYFARLRDGATIAVLLAPVRYLMASASSFIAWILALPALIRALLSNDAPEHTGVEGLDSGSDDDAGSETGDATEEIPAYRRLRRCWRWLVRRVVRQSRTKTAVEVEKRAVEKGLPVRPVRRLRRAFQDVEYGYADPDERVDVAEESVERLREDTEDTEQ
jgi:transglutaminase-like putative cysteine protease